MDRKRIAAAIALIAVMAIIAVPASSDSSDGAFRPDSYPARLAVLGNADLDSDISEDDAVLIERIAEDGYESYSDVYMCDANFDGKIDSADAEMVRAMVRAQSAGDWSGVGKIHYVNVDKRIASYDMTGSNKVIALIAPPLDSVLAMGGRDLVVGFDDRITAGKYHAEYASTFDFSRMYDVGNCSEPDTEVITEAWAEYGGVTVVCGTRDSYGPSLETVFDGTAVQIVRVASWEYGETVYGFVTLGYLLKLSEGASGYMQWYDGVGSEVDSIVSSAPDSDGSVGAAAAYAYGDELSLLGEHSGEHAGLMALRPYDSAGSFLGTDGGGHGNTVTNESISAMYASHSLRNLALMVGTPFQTADQATSSYIVSNHAAWLGRIDASSMDGLNVCTMGYSFSSGVSEVLNRLILCYWMYNDEFLAHFGCSTQKDAQDVLASYVDAYCAYIGIDGSWSFYGTGGTTGMNLLYCGEGDERNIMYGPEGARCTILGRRTGRTRGSPRSMTRPREEASPSSGRSSSC